MDTETASFQPASVCVSRFFVSCCMQTTSRAQLRNVAGLSLFFYDAGELGIQVTWLRVTMWVSQRERVT